MSCPTSAGDAMIESFNGRFRAECLNAHWFLSLADAQRKIEAWLQSYDEAGPHSALERLTPSEFAHRAVHASRHFSAYSTAWSSVIARPSCQATSKAASSPMAARAVAT